MSLQRLTIAQMRDLILARKLVEDPTLDTGPHSDAWVDANAVAHLAALLQEDASALALGLNPATATGLDLDALAAAWLPSDHQRESATAWLGMVTLDSLSEPPTDPVPFGTQFVSGGGIAYQTTAEIPPTAWLAGHATTTASSILTAAGVYPGAAANAANGTACTVTSPPTGVSSHCVIASTTTAAKDRETDEQLRLRILIVTKMHPGGGNAADYVAWAQSVDGVVGAFVYPRWYDGATPAGTLLVCPWGPSGARIVSADTLSEVVAAIAAHTPVVAVPTTGNPDPSYCDLGIYIRPAAGYEPDWSGSYAVSSCPSPYDRVNLTTDPTGTIEIGDRIVGHRTGTYLQTETQRTVVEVGTNYVIVSDPFPWAVSGSIYPGGPLWDPVVAAITSVYDGLGASKSTDPTKPRFPPVRESAPSDLCVSDVYAAAEAVEGVQSSRINWINGSSTIADVVNEVIPGGTPALLVVTESDVTGIRVRWE